MIQKIELTKKILKDQNPNFTTQDLKTALGTWWISRRTKPKGGLRLTADGFNKLNEFGYQCHKVRYDEKMQFSNLIAVWLDQNINCPYYLTNDNIFLFGERDAIQLVLFSGNIPKMIRAHLRANNKVN
jgi:hypothetical protein